MTRRAAAIFDLDRTLLAVNSGTLWFKRERAAGRLPLVQAVEAAGWMGLYGLGLMNGEVALGRAVRGIAGEAESVLIDRLNAFYDEELAHALRATNREGRASWADWVDQALAEGAGGSGNRRSVRISEPILRRWRLALCLAGGGSTVRGF